MPDQERDAAAFTRWLEERLGSHVSPCHCDAVAESAWHAALASVEKERAAAEGLRAAAQQHLDWVDGAIRTRFTVEAQENAGAIARALAAYRDARAGAGETEEGT